MVSFCSIILPGPMPFVFSISDKVTFKSNAFYTPVETLFTIAPTVSPTFSLTAFTFPGAALHAASATIPGLIMIDSFFIFFYRWACLTIIGLHVLLKWAAPIFEVLRPFRTFFHQWAAPMVEVLRPFRAMHTINGLHPLLRYFALSGL